MKKETIERSKMLKARMHDLLDCIKQIGIEDSTLLGIESTKTCLYTLSSLLYSICSRIDNANRILTNTIFDQVIHNIHVHFKKEHEESKGKTIH